MRNFFQIFMLFSAIYHVGGVPGFPGSSIRTSNKSDWNIVTNDLFCCSLSTYPFSILYTSLLCFVNSVLLAYTVLSFNQRVVYWLGMGSIPLSGQIKRL